MKPTVYIPNLNGGERLLGTLESLAGQSAAAGVVVVDNGSTDRSVERASRRFPDARWVTLPTNQGFGRALNLAVRAYPADPLIFLNNDVRCEPDFVAALLHEVGSGVDAVAGVLIQGARPDRIDSAGVVVDRTLLAFDYLHGETPSRAQAASAPLGPTGGAALLRLDAFNAVGGFDARLFAYLEDVDLALRLRLVRPGRTCRLAGAARAEHHHSATLGAGSRQKAGLMGFGRGYLLRRYGVLRDPLLVVRAMTGEAIMCTAQLAVDRTTAGLSGRLRGWRTAAQVPRLPIPVDAASSLSLADALRLRGRRAAGARATAARLALRR